MTASSLAPSAAVGQAVRLGHGLRAAAAADGDDATRRPASGTYTVVALRVAFQPDTTRFTTGDGTFGGPLYDDGLQPEIDPLPHDAGYFEAHLAFLEDYVARASDGRAAVETRLLPEVVQVPGRMGDYSPTGFDATSDDELRKLAALAEDAWRAADAQMDVDLTGLDPARTAFVLFHAGVGRDLELIGTTLDKTPQDLPSLFFDGAALRRLGAEPGTVGGLPVTNTLVMPRTETRQGFDFIQDEAFLVEFSINGLLAASFFNFLGVPDLFNTETGESAVGPFGLMDALGIFAYSGLFPPEPSAWTKWYLGWTGDVAVLDAAGQTASLRAASLPDANDVAVAYASPAEYFLVENRQRDPEGDGLVLQVWRDGAVTEQRVTAGDSSFTAFDVSGFAGGVVVSADNYDWALPGGFDEDDVLRDGGILIWHVDERVLQAGLPTNTINVDPDRRAVDVEEADGAQDLGFPSPGAFGPDFDLGTPFDFWYEGNPAVVVTRTGREIRFYQNRFGPDTTPSSDNNRGGETFIVLRDFSPSATTMSFVYDRADAAGLAPRPLLSLDVAAADDAFDVGSKLTRFGADASYLAAYGVEDGWTVVSLPDGTVADVREGRLTAPAETAPGRLEAAGRSLADSVVVVAFDAGAASRFAHPVADALRGARLTSPLVFGDGQRYAMFETETGRTGVLSIPAPGVDGEAAEVALPSGIGDVRSLAFAPQAGPVVAGTRGAALGEGSVAWSYATSPREGVGQVAFGEDGRGYVGVVPVAGDDGGGRLLLLRSDGVVTEMRPAEAIASVLASTPPVDGVVDAPDLDGFNPFPMLADVDGDRRLDVVTTQGAYLVAVTQTGAFVDGFPRAIPSASTAQPLVADGPEGPRVVVGGADGYLYAYDLAGRIRTVAGFPLSVGTAQRATPLVSDGLLAAVTLGGAVTAVDPGAGGGGGWTQLYADAQNQSFVRIVSGSPEPTPASDALLTAGGTYNWPNPIRAGQTFLRVEPTAPCRVEIQIVDGAGQLVDELTMESVPGGVPSEIAWQTDAASGLYFARVRAEALDGRTETRVVKMAIIR